MLSIPGLTLSSRQRHEGAVNTPAARFWSKVERRRGCWVWKARIDRGGYGIFSVSRSTLVRAHRYAWELLRGELPSATCLLHRCKERRCVNPAHLYMGSAHDSHAPHPQVSASPSPSQAPSPSNIERRPSGDAHWTHRQPSRVRRGEQSNLSKLRASDVLRIRALHARGASAAELADRFHVVRETVANILGNRTWRGVGRKSKRA
jgi:HNH endonuclease